MQCSLSPPARRARLQAAPHRSSACGGVQRDRRRRRLPLKNGSVVASAATTPRRAAHAAHSPSARAPCALKRRRHVGAAHTALVTTADRPLGCPGPLQGPGSPSDRHVCAPPPLQPPRARPPPWGPPTQHPAARVRSAPFCTLRRRRSTAAAAAAAAAAEAVDAAAPLPECKGRGQRSRRRFGGWSAALRTRRKRRRGPWVTAAAAAWLGSCEGVKYAGPGARGRLRTRARPARGRGRLAAAAAARDHRRARPGCCARADRQLAAVAAATPIRRSPVAREDRPSALAAAPSCAPAHSTRRRNAGRFGSSCVGPHRHRSVACPVLTDDSAARARGR